MKTEIIPYIFLCCASFTTTAWGLYGLVLCFTTLRSHLFQLVQIEEDEQAP